MNKFELHCTTLYYMILSFIAGIIAGFVSFIIACGFMLFFWGTWNRFSISFAIGSVIGLLLFLSVLSGTLLLFI